MTVEIETADQVAVVTLAWTAKRNALNPGDARDIASAIREVGASEAACLVLTGRGAFCSGGDLRALAELSATLDVAGIRRHVYRDIQGMFMALRECPVPIIAALDGAAVGLGMDLALACDMRILGPKGWMQQGWALAGLIPATGGAYFLQRLVPTRIWQLVADQTRIDAERAYDWGLGEIGKPTALEAAVARGQQLASHGRELLEDYVKLSRPALWPPPEHFQLAGEIQGRRLGSQRFRDAADQILGSQR